MNNPLKIYIAGPISGLPKKEAMRNFKRAEKLLKESGYKPINPLRDEDYKMSWQECMRKDLLKISKADGIFMLRGWVKSKGANIEFQIAKGLGLVILYDNGAKESITEEAHRIVHTSRGPQYGHPAKNFVDIAKMWEVILGNEVTPEQVALMMIAMKVCRENNRHQRDNPVDISGYAETLDMIHEYKERLQCNQSGVQVAEKSKIAKKQKKVLSVPLAESVWFPHVKRTLKI